MKAKKTWYLQKNPFKVPVPGGKQIFEHFGNASMGGAGLSLAHMFAPAGWSEPPQTPDFDEYTLVIRGRKRVTAGGESIDLAAGESILIEKGTTVQYSNPFDRECEYISVCVPAFRPESVHRQQD